jgi:hypothetical protein
MDVLLSEAQYLCKLACNEQSGLAVAYQDAERGKARLAFDMQVSGRFTSAKNANHTCMYSGEQKLVEIENFEISREFQHL